MSPQDAVKLINKEVVVENPKVSGKMLFTAYIFRIRGRKKLYQAEVQNICPPHEIYIVSLDDVKRETDETTANQNLSDV